MRRIRLAVILCMAAMALPVGAETPRPVYPDFTFKRIAAPKAGTLIVPGGAKRITVQIDPAEQAARMASLPKPSGADQSGKDWDPPAGSLPDLPGSTRKGGSEAAYGWFWDAVSPKLSEGAGRFPVAVSALDKGPGGSAVAAPRLQFMQEIAQAHGTDILAATVGTKVSPALVLAVIGIESAGRTDALSSKGASGLMQLIPATAARFGVTDSTDPVDNIRGGVAYLDWLMGEFDSDPLMVLAAYNAGENAVRGNDGVPDFAETRDYVPKVLAAWTVARGLCLTPPELVTDGCVFAVQGAG